jgi:DNA polymerase-1
VQEQWQSFTVREPDPKQLFQFMDAMELRTLTKRVREHFAREKGAEIVATYAAGAIASPEATPTSGGLPEEANKPFLREKYEIVRDIETLEKVWIAGAKKLGAVGIDVEADGFDAARANLVGVSLALGPNVACYVPLAHRAPDARAGELFASESDAPAASADMGKQIPMAQAIGALKSLFEDASVLKVGLNIKFDVAMFARQGVALAPIDDPMLISYTLYGGLNDHSKAELVNQHLEHALTPLSDVAGKGKSAQSFDLITIDRAAAFSAEYADAALRLSRKLKPRLAQDKLLTVYETLERPLPSVLSAMEREGVKVDTQMLSRLSGDFAQRMLQYEEEAYGLAGKQFNIGSPKQLGEILFDELKLPGGSKTKTGAWSTDATILETLAEQHDLPNKVLEWRQISKLRSTYTEALGQAVNPQTQRVHTTYALAASTTGRLASNDPNLQNIPIRTEEGRRIREAFIAEKGNVLVSADYSQIELRLLAHVANIPQLKQAFADGIDIHARTASEMFGVPVEGMPKEIRNNAKAINFGIIYGISAFGLARNLGIEREEASAYIKRYFERFPGIRDYMEETKAFARANGYVRTLFGRRIWIAGIKSKNVQERNFGERQAINAPLQGAAADIIRRAMIRLPDALSDAGLKARMLLQVHDELVFEAPKAEADALCALAKRVMEAAPEPVVQLSIPLTVEAKSGATWGAAH